MRYFLELSYSGKAYNGWQIQNNAPSVQQTLQEALSTILRVTTGVVGAGRTDTGVHAARYVAHFDVECPLEEPQRFCYHLNAILPWDAALEPYGCWMSTSIINLSRSFFTLSYCRFFIKNFSNIEQNLSAKIPLLHNYSVSSHFFVQNDGYSTGYPSASSGRSIYCTGCSCAASGSPEVCWA